MTRFLSAALAALFVAAAAAQTLSSPAISGPLSGQTIDDVDPLLWTAVPGASRYQVELCGDAACSDILGRATVPNLYSLLRKPVGSLAWRVAAIDAAGNRGAWSPVTRFTVAHQIAGTIYEDTHADNDAAGLNPRPGVRMRLFRDGGDGVPGNDDAIVAATESDKRGMYSFHPAAAGTYWIAADAATFTPAAGFNAGGAANARAEQTWGGVGAMCLLFDGTISVRRGGGPCFAGRGVIDDGTHLATARHLARATYGDRSVTEVDFGFSFDAVTSLADGAATGTLRQFVVNANAVRGANTMRFVPMIHAPNDKWWSIRLTSALPALTDGGTTIDGTAWSAVDPAFAIDKYEGTLVPSNDHVVTGRSMIAPPRPELEVTLAGERGIDAPVAIAIRNIAIGGARTNVLSRVALDATNTAIGMKPDGVPMAAASDNGIVVETGAAHLDGVLIAGQTTFGLLVRPAVALTAHNVFVTRCGTANSGAAIALTASDASITDSFVFENDAPGIIVGGNEAVPTRHATIRGSAISHNRAGIVLAQNAVQTVIEENDIVWNGEGGIIINPSPVAPPRATRISRNHYNENGGVPIDLQHQTEKVKVANSSCRNTGLADEGLGAPHVTRADVQVAADKKRNLAIEGTACPGTTIELYESFITGDLREPIERERQARDLSSVREAVNKQTVESRDNAGSGVVDIIPSVGEFNYATTVTADAAGHFSASIPIVEATVAGPTKRRQNLGENAVVIDMYDVFRGKRTYAVAAISIDAAGNTSEFSRRHIVGDRSEARGR